MKWITIALLGFSMASVAQTAKVIALSPNEAKEAKALYDEQQDIAKRQNTFNNTIAHKYTMTGNTLTAFGTSNVSYQYKDGWYNGFVYSDDFKFIVPMPYQQLNGNSFSGCSIQPTGISVPLN